MGKNSNNEKWVVIDGFEDYLISNMGRLLSLRGENPIIVKPSKNNDGYYQYPLMTDNGKVTKKISRLVAIAFLDNPENKPEVNHINSIRHDDRVENLEWCTREENIKHSFKLGNASRKGSNNSRSVLSVKQVVDIRERFLSGERQIDLAKEYNVTKFAIHSVVKRRTWRHI